MADQISLSPEQMRQRANQYKTQSEVVESVIKEMDTLLNQLQSEWKGQSSEAYAARFQELRPSFVNAQTLIMEISTALNSTANIMANTDTEIASQFRG